ncbi:MAG: DUF1320 family protein [Deltaproteobacteria bacterium]|jgi:phage gp36-like protein|nr:DUF1320 family protein [Deltaproteobacteria bacterium]
MAISAYARKTELKKRYGDEIDELSKAQSKTETSIDAALEDGAAEINGYIGQRYKLPLPYGPYSTLVWLNCDITRYRLWESRLEDAPDNAVYVRYKQSIEHLMLIAEGRIALIDDQGQEPEIANKAIAGLSVISRRPQVFTNNTLKKMNYGY